MANNVIDLQKEILDIKKKTGTFILAHTYQGREICEVADVVGDSFQLSVAASKVENKSVLMCGVHFMAETVKILSPEKKVILANEEAGCPMAEQFGAEEVKAFRKKNPDYTVVSYINTTAALKCVTDVCVTSSSAVKIVEKIDNQNILFIPDCNLGDYVSKQVSNKNIKTWMGGCPVHARITKADALRMKEKHPNALFLVHPECRPEVVELADYIGSTSGIMEYAKKSDAKEFIIGTETSITEHLSYECRDKSFYSLSKHLICPNMKITNLMDVYNSLTGRGGLEIEMDKQTLKDARKCIDEMIRLGK